MLTDKEKIRLNKKLRKLQSEQAERRAELIVKLGLAKNGDENWEKFKFKRIKAIDKYLDLEFKQTRNMYIRALYNLRKGIKSPLIDI